MYGKKPIFIIHKHHATHLHYDLRLEINGTLKSWALRKIPTKPSQPELAIQVADHPLWYRHFEGVIPEGNYGAGPVIIWDKGLYSSFMKNPKGKKISPGESLNNGLMLLFLEGKKLKGSYILVRISKKQRWLLIKMNDEFVYADKKPKNWNRSVKSNKTLLSLLKEKS